MLNRPSSKTLLLAASLAFLGTGCGDEADPEPEAPSTTEYESVVEGVYDRRYCEVLLINLGTDPVIIKVFNSLAFNDCPHDLWEALDPEAIKAEQGADMVQMNGPRYFIMDEIHVTPTVEPEVIDFGGIDMGLAATVEIPLSELMSGQGAYIERTVKRTNMWVFYADRRVYELTSDTGQPYLMQAYARIVDPDLSLPDLEALGEELQVPDGWTYSSRVLAEELRLETVDNSISVLQDELQNTYQKLAQ
jgi:haloalkane dehalogenase